MAEKGVAAVDRALEILKAFTHSASDHLSLAELAAVTGFYKSTILRLCESLQKADYLIRDLNGNFRLGAAGLTLGSRYQDTFDLGEIVVPALRQLSRDTGESSSFYVREGERRICLHRVNSTQHQILHFLKEGTAYPVYTGASGQIFQAFGADSSKEFDEVRENMVAVSLKHRTISETGAVAVPIFGVADKLVGTLGIAGPRNRFTPETVELFKRQLLGTADLVSKKLGKSSNLFDSALKRLEPIDVTPPQANVASLEEF